MYLLVYGDKIIEIIKSHSKILLYLVILLIVIVAAVFIIDYAYFPKPPEDQLVVAISPFYLIDEYGQSGSDFNTANDFKEMLEAKKDLGIKVIMLDYSVRNTVEGTI